MSGKKSPGVFPDLRIRGKTTFFILAACASLIAGANAYSQHEFADSAAIPKESRAAVESIKAGITREAVGHLCRSDGGIQGPPGSSERYILPGYADNVKPQVLMIDIRFKPAAVPDSVYNNAQLFANWRIKHPEVLNQAATDLVVSVSRPYFSPPAYD